MDSLQQIYNWLAAFPLASVGGLYWVILWTALVLLLITVVRGRHGAPWVGLLAISVILMVVVHEWYLTAGALVTFVTVLFYVVSIVAFALVIRGIFGLFSRK